MGCLHCIHDCKPEGEDMSLETFRKALKLVEDRGGGPITLGGGEPTLHPEFEQMLIEAMAMNTWDEEECVPCVITNGSHRRRAIMLARLAEKGMVASILSLDQYHDRDMVHEEVVNAFTWNRRPGEGRLDYRRRRPRDYRDIRTETTNLVNGGRCDFGHDEKYCLCPGREVRPNGDMYMCGCQPSQLIGNVATGVGMDLLRVYDDMDCCKELQPDMIKEYAIYDYKTNNYPRGKDHETSCEEEKLPNDSA
jgi:MoaA/NifB/PqqE/SkfB family radical SAM enzyme